MSMYFIEEQDDMELADVAKAIDEAGFNVGAVRVMQAMKEIKYLRAVIGDALSSFECTQIISDYPVDHWSRRAEELIRPNTKIRGAL